LLLLQIQQMIRIAIKIKTTKVKTPKMNHHLLLDNQLLKPLFTFGFTITAYL